MSQWVIKKLLDWVNDYFAQNNIESPRLAAEILLSSVLAMTRIELYTHFDEPVAKRQLDKLHELVKRAVANEPVQYLVGRTEFYSVQLEIDRNCLIPRPETELLVERGIEFLRKRDGRQFVCDLCTGSGCIAVAIAKNFLDADLIATDICDAALSVAAKNVENHQLNDRIKLLCGDLFSPIITELDEGRFDLIVCNPPYVTAGEFEALGANVKDYEPKLALLAGSDGLDVYRRIVESVEDFLKADAALMLEIGYSQGPPVRELLERAGCFGKITIEKDFHNNDRIVTASKNH